MPWNQSGAQGLPDPSPMGGAQAVVAKSVSQPYTSVNVMNWNTAKSPSVIEMVIRECELCHSSKGELVPMDADSCPLALRQELFMTALKNAARVTDRRQSPMQH